MTENKFVDQIILVTRYDRATAKLLEEYVDICCKECGAPSEDIAKAKKALMQIFVCGFAMDQELNTILSACPVFFEKIGTKDQFLYRARREGLPATELGQQIIYFMAQKIMTGIALEDQSRIDKETLERAMKEISADKNRISTFQELMAHIFAMGDIMFSTSPLASGVMIILPETYSDDLEYIKSEAAKAKI